VAAACVYVYVWANVQTYHADVVQSTVLYRSGNRDLRELRHTVEPNHIRTIVSLVSDAEVNDPAKPQFRQEADYCRDHGIQLVRIPVKLGGWPTADQIKQFLGVVALPENRPVLVHCAQGVRRTGMFVAAFQLSVQDRSKDATRAAVQTFGHKPRDTDDVQTFIDNYDPAGNLPTTMPAAVSGD
jgi:protein tyrosine phosphatase (PTP) superfamily phosphohydrolase (DUF442 family)